MRRLTDRLAKLEASRSDVTSRSRILFGRDDADLISQRDAMIRQGRATETDEFIFVSWASSMGDLMARVADKGTKLHSTQVASSKTRLQGKPADFAGVWRYQASDAVRKAPKAQTHARSTEISATPISASIRCGGEHPSAALVPPQAPPRRHGSFFSPHGGRRLIWRSIGGILAALDRVMTVVPTTMAASVPWPSFCAFPRGLTARPSIRSAQLPVNDPRTIGDFDSDCGLGPSPMPTQHHLVMYKGVWRPISGRIGNSLS